MIYLGTIANVGTDVLNNLNTATPFTIPTWVEVLRLQPSAATQMAATEIAVDAVFAPAATAMLQLGAANSYTDIPVVRTQAFGLDPGIVPGPLTVAIRKTDAGAGTCKVFALGRS